MNIILNSNSHYQRFTNHRRKLDFMYEEAFKMNKGKKLDSLNDDVLLHTLKFVGLKSFSTVGAVSKRFHSLFELIPKETFYGSASENLIDELYNGYISDNKEEELKKLRFGVSRGIVCFNNAELMNWALGKNDTTLIQNLCTISAREGNIHVMEYMCEERGEILSKLKRKPEFCTEAASSGKLSMLKWLRDKGFSWSSNTCSLASAGGHLAVVKWARMNGCQTDFRTSGFAAKNGHLDVLKYCKETGLEFGEVVYHYAALGNQVEVLNWLKGTSIVPYRVRMPGISAI